MKPEAREITRIVAVQLGCEEVEIEARLVEDLDASSVDLVNLVVAVEERFRISIPEEEAVSLRTVRDLHDLVCQLRGA